MSRLPELTPENMNAEQKRVYDDIASGPRGGVRGPFMALLHSPTLADCVQRLGAFVRYDCSVPQKLRELAILITARHWMAPYEWHAHEPHARKAGLDDGIIEAVRAGKRPPFTEPAEAAVYDFVTELYETHRVSDENYAAVVAVLGPQGVVDLTGLLGHYGVISMTIKVFEVPLPEGTPDPFTG
jgi:4-carboxymuconolactone decarboxylase